MFAKKGCDVGWCLLLIQYNMTAFRAQSMSVLPDLNDV